MNIQHALRHIFVDTLVGQVTFNFLYFAALWWLGRGNKEFDRIRLLHEGRVRHDED